MHEEERKEATERIYKALRSGGLYITFENCAADNKRLIQLELKRWGEYQAARGKTKEEVDAHLARYNVNYFPITMEAHLQLLKEVGFHDIQVFWKSYMQIGIFAIKSV